MGLKKKEMEDRLSIQYTPRNVNDIRDFKRIRCIVVKGLL